MRRRLVAMIAAGALALLGLMSAIEQAVACACCSEVGTRAIGVGQFDDQVRTLFGRLRFAPEARLADGIGDGGRTRGIVDIAPSYDIAVEVDDTRFVFAFNSRRKGKTGTLTLALPTTFSFFVVDPRTDTDRGLGPTLYKEYIISAKAEGDGVFGDALAGDAQVSLIIHGHGRGCTEAEDFHSWTISVNGRNAEYMLIGALTEPK